MNSGLSDLFRYFIANQEKVLTLVLEHLFLFALSMGFALVIGILLSIFATRPGREKTGMLVISFTGAAQAVPPVAVIALAFLFVGIGAFPSILALILYSLVPIVFNTTSGIMSISPDIKEAARGIGLSKRQVLFKVSLPVAMPVIMAGVRIAATINIATATVASFIGGGGLGDLIFMGLKLYRADIILTGSVLVAILALVIDVLLKKAGDLIISKGLTGQT